MERYGAVTIHSAMAAVMADVQAVKKGERNVQQGFNFRGVDAVVNAVGPVLRKHKVIVTPDVRSVEYKQVEVGKSRVLMAHVQITVAYTFHAEDGSTLTCSAAGEAMDSGDKATPKAMSVAFRTALLQALCLPTDDPDPDSQVYERSAPIPSLQESKRAIWSHARGDDDEQRKQWVAAAITARGMSADNPNDMAALAEELGRTA